MNTRIYAKPRSEWTWGEFVKNDILPEFPDFKIVKKSESGLMKFWSWFLFLVTFGQTKRDKFMQGTLTAFLGKVYIPDSWVDGSRSDHHNMIKTLVHERQHLRQAERMGAFRHGLAYAFWPFPIFWAHYRLDAECEATAAGTSYGYRVYGHDPFGASYKRHIESFRSSLYFWPTLSEKRVRRVLSHKINSFLPVDR